MNRYDLRVSSVAIWVNTRLGESTHWLLVPTTKQDLQIIKGASGKGRGGAFPFNGQPVAVLAVKVRLRDGHCVFPRCPAWLGSSCRSRYGKPQASQWAR